MPLIKALSTFKRPAFFVAAGCIACIIVFLFMICCYCRLSFVLRAGGGAVIVFNNPFIKDSGNLSSYWNAMDTAEICIYFIYLLKILLYLGKHQTRKCEGRKRKENISPKTNPDLTDYSIRLCRNGIFLFFSFSLFRLTSIFRLLYSYLPSLCCASHALRPGCVSYFPFFPDS